MISLLILSIVLCMLFINLELHVQLLIGINHLTPISDQDRIYLSNINTLRRKLMRIKIYLFNIFNINYGDSKLIQYQILHTNIMGIVWQIVRRIVNKIL